MSDTSARRSHNRRATRCWGSRRSYAELDASDATENSHLGWRRALDLVQKVAESHPNLPHGRVLSAFADWVRPANGSSGRGHSLLVAVIEEGPWPPQRSPVRGERVVRGRQPSRFR